MKYLFCASGQAVDDELLDQKSNRSTKASIIPLHSLAFFDPPILWSNLKIGAKTSK